MAGEQCGQLVQISTALTYAGCDQLPDKPPFICCTQRKMVKAENLAHDLYSPNALTRECEGGT